MGEVTLLAQHLLTFIVDFFPLSRSTVEGTLCCWMNYSKQCDEEIATKSAMLSCISNDYYLHILRIYASSLFCHFIALSYSRLVEGQWLWYKEY